jgi:protein-disulfide isomerase
LRHQAEVSIYLSPPKLDIGYDPGRVRGTPDAPITIVEFSDFQCPFCRSAYPIVKELLSKYQGRIKLAYRDFPLEQIHSQAELAAEAAWCAREQGKFWEYHDLLFTNPEKLAPAGLTEHARTLQLDEKLFTTCLSNGKFRANVEGDLQAGTQAGVTGTPAFFINGILLTGAQPISVFEKAIDGELVRVGRQHIALTFDEQPLSPYKKNVAVTNAQPLKNSSF